MLSDMPLQIGAALVRVVLEKMTVWDESKNQEVAGFRHGIEMNPSQSKKFPCGSISASIPLKRLIDRGHHFTSVLDPKLLPMIVEPLMWIDADKGCYLNSKNFVMRVHGYDTLLPACSSSRK